jgi:O-antigen ligase
VRDYLTRYNLIYSPDWWNHRAIMTLEFMDFRPNFPVGHHNRVANMMMMLSCLGAAWVVWPGESRRWRHVAIVITAGFLLVLALTKVRGAWLSFGAGMVICTLLIYRPWGGWRHHVAAAAVVLSIAGAWLVMPQIHRERVMKIFQFHAQEGEQDHNILRRIHSIHTAFNMFERHKNFGVGYGSRIYTRLYQHFEPPRNFDDPTPTEHVQPHAHMNWAQVAAEEGQFGLYSLLLVQLSVMALSFWGARAAMAEASPMTPVLVVLLAGQCMMLLYGLTNYSLRYSLGLMVFVIMILNAILAVSWHRHQPTPQPVH